MKLIFHPVRSDAALVLERAGETLRVNGVDFDFAPLPDGAELPPEAIDSPAFCGPVRRLGGALEIPLTLPHGAGAGAALRHPLPLVVSRDGPIPLPQEGARSQEGPRSQEGL